MLTLSRRIGEVVVITLPDGQVVKLTVVEVRPDQARLGIEAPKGVPVVREELRR